MKQVESFDDISSSKGLSSLISSIANVISHDNFSNAQRAALRRAIPGQPLPLAFYRFAFQHLPEGWELRMDAWVTIISGITLMSPQAHNSQISAGKALAESGFSESRIERLLAAEDMALYTLLLRAVRFLHAKMQPINWIDLAYLVLTKDPLKLERARFYIARDYYRNQKEKEK